MNLLKKRVVPGFLALCLVFITGCSEEFDTLPDPPSRVQADPDDSQITVSWTPSWGAIVHTVFMAPVFLNETPTVDNPGSAPILVNLVDANGTHGSVELDPGKSFKATFISDLAVTTTVAVNVEAVSGPVTATVNGEVAAPDSGQNFTFVLEWDFESILPEVEIFHGETCCEITQTGLTNGDGYLFWVTAANRIGESGNSRPAFGTPMIPTP